MKYDVFISYSRKDSEVVELLKTTLAKSDLTFFVDRNDIELGSDFAEVIAKAIYESELMLFVWSESSNQSEQTANEVALALDFQKIIVPIKIGSFVAHYNLAYRLGRKNRIEAACVNEIVANELCNSINRILGRAAKDRLNTTAVSKDDGEYIDEHGVIFSNNRKKLIKVPRDLVTYRVPEGTEIICDKAFFRRKNIKRVYLPDSILRIGDRAFLGCLNIIQIDLPKNLIHIGIYAFFECGNDFDFFIPATTNTIGYGAFNCGNNYISIDCNNNSFRVVDGVLYDYNITTAISIGGAVTHYHIPNTVKKISQSAFSWNNNITKVDIPDSVEFVDNYAFFSNLKLEIVNFPSSIIEVGYEIFHLCENLDTIYIGDGEYERLSEMLHLDEFANYMVEKKM